jgi:hypothetical protein
MDANVTGEWSLQATRETLAFHSAGCYAVPIRFLYGTAAEINFWDVIYYRAHETGGAFDTSTKELAEQAGLSRQMFGQLHRKAVEQSELVVDHSWDSGRRFFLRVPDFDRLTKGVIWKPLGYVRNGWHRVVTPAIPKRVLNLYLQQPRQRVYHLDTTYIASKCKRYLPGTSPQPQEPLNLADVGKALRLLVRLGLLESEETGFRIDWAAFHQPARTVALPFAAPGPHEHPLFRNAVAADPIRAERALELLEIGQYDGETHFADIFRDLSFLHDDDYPLLKAKVHRYRNRPPGPNRWRDTWKAFQYELKRRVATVRASKSILSLDKLTFAALPLKLDVGQAPGQVFDMRIVSRVEWPWYLQERTVVELELRSGDTVFWTRSVGACDGEVRHLLHPHECLGLTAPLVLRAQCDRPLPGLHVEAWLEARLRR